MLFRSAVAAGQGKIGGAISAGAGEVRDELGVLVVRMRRHVEQRAGGRETTELLEDFRRIRDRRRRRGSGGQRCGGEDQGDERAHGGICVSGRRRARALAFETGKRAERGERPAEKPARKPVARQATFSTAACASRVETTTWSTIP